MPLFSNRNQSKDDALLCSGYVEVRAIEGPGGRIKDEIMIVVPLPEETEKELDEDPLYYYPPSHKGHKHQRVYADDDEDTCSESDSDEEEEDSFDVNASNTNSRSMIPNNNNSNNAINPAKVLDEEHSFMEELLQTLDNIFGCSYGGCDQTISTPVLKSALRRKGSSEASFNRNVSFTKLEIREFNMTLGNHPNAVTGPPVMLEWGAQPTREAVIDLEKYELARQPRRNRKELKLSFEARRGILENDRGFTVEEVKQAWSEALKIRKQRQETRQQTPAQKLCDEFYESACRKYNRFLSFPTWQ